MGNHIDSTRTKWFDISSFCKSSLHLISRQAEIKDIHYFSALARHTMPEQTEAIGLVDFLKLAGGDSVI